MSNLGIRHVLSAKAALPLAAVLFATGAKGPSILWPILGIAAIFIAAILIARFVRGDPYYDQHASHDRRESGPAPFSGDGDGSWF